jgi:Rps23 Pro-64 3,4-dihydroxylase Tpa1-like proline 4-hydroxylase
MPNLPRNEEQEKLRLARVAKRDAAVLATQKGKEAQERVMSDPRRIEALKRMQDFHIKGEEAKINATSKTRANSPQVREAAKKEYTDYQSKLKDDYITNKIKKEQLDYISGKRSNARDIKYRMRNPFNPFTNSPAMALQREIQDQEKYLAAKQNQPTGMKKGGAVKSASSRADGCAVRGKTRA